MNIIKQGIALAGTLMLSLPTFVLASPTVSVPNFRDKSGNFPSFNDRLAKQLADILSNELSNAGVSIVERQEIAGVLSEQELAELGIVSKTARNNSTAKKGQMKGAQFIVMGGISAYDENAGKVATSGGGSFMGMGSSKSSVESKVYIALDLRIVNSTTGEIVASKTVEATAKNTQESKSQNADLSQIGGLISQNAGSAGGRMFGQAFGSFKSNKSTTVEQKVPRKKAIRAVMIKAADYTSCMLVRRDSCIAEYAAEDKQRRSNTMDLLDFD